MEATKERMAALVAAFFEGTTSVEEERELYARFRSPGCPAEWMSCKELFRWFAEGAGPEAESVRPRPMKGRYAWAGWSLAGVAAVALLCIVWPGRGVDGKSFVRCNGVVVTDARTIEAAGRRLEADFARAEAAVGRLETQFERFQRQWEEK